LELLEDENSKKYVRPQKALKARVVSMIIYFLSKFMIFFFFALSLCLMIMRNVSLGLLIV